MIPLTRWWTFLQYASIDPDVLAIKQTLYRVGRNSPVVRALLRARRDYGKQVAVLVELQARFDEESNIEWAKLLEQEGVHVTYGLMGLKTHSKVTLVVRKEGEHIRRYCIWRREIITTTQPFFMKTSACSPATMTSVQMLLICLIT
jgi:polyphosphate kinase